MKGRNMRQQSPIEISSKVFSRQQLRRELCVAFWFLLLLTVATLGKAQTMDSPMRIAVGPPGEILVSDSVQDKVIALDTSTLAEDWSFDVQGTPMAVAYASNLVFIGNATTHNVEVYRLQGTPNGPGVTLNFVCNLGLTAPGTTGTIRIPSDIDIDKDSGLVFVVDSGERKVKVFDKAGNTVSELPSSTDGPLLSPTAITVDTTRQEVLVSDYGDPNGWFKANVPARIMIYSYSGTFLAKIDGGASDTNAQFDRPQGLDTDGRGHIFMAESLKGQIFVFDRTTGALVQKLSSFGNQPGQLELPLDLVIDKKTGNLFVTNNMLKRIEVFPAAGGLQ